MTFYVLNVLAMTSSRDGYCRFDFLRDSELGDATRCPKCGVAIGPRPALPPFTVKLFGDRLGDVCTSGFGSEILLSSNFVAAWLRSGLVGLKVYPPGTSKLRLPPLLRASGATYQMATVESTLTKLDHDASGLVVSRQIGCEVCDVAQRRRVARLRIDESTWHGEDLFFASGLFGVVVATERVVEFTRSEGLTNAKFIHQDEYREERES